MSGVLVLARDLCPGDVLLLGEYPVDLIEIDHSRCGLVALRWSVCDRDVMVVSSATPMNRIGRLEE
jgi:hypothetical protein